MEIKSQFEFGNKTAYVTYRDAESFDDLKDKNVTQVYAFCFCKDKIVLVHNKNSDSLSLPGGGLEKEETFEDCLKREIKEETNMKVLSFAPIGYQEVTSNESPAVFQLRYTCIVEPYGDFASDPDGDVDGIKIIDPKEFKEYIKWGEVGDRIFERTLELKQNILKTETHTKIKNENNETVKAGCVVVNDKNEILLLGDQEGKIWTFPKGHAENGETLEQTALREVREETGYEVQIEKRLSDLTYTHGGTGELIRVAMFKAKPIRELTKSLEEEEKYSQSAWFPFEKAKEILYYNLAFLLEEI